MAFPNVSSSELYQWTVMGISDGQAIVNVFHGTVVTSEGDPVPENTIPLSDVNQALRGRFRVDILPLLADPYVVQEYRIAAVRIAGPAVNGKRPIGLGPYIAEIGDAALDAGTYPLPALPTYVATSVTLRGFLGGEAVRGGKRFGPLGEALTDNTADGNELTAAGHAAHVQDVGDLLAEVIVGPNAVWRWRIFSRQRAQLGTLETMASYAATIFDFTVSPVVGSQVSRKRRRLQGQ